MCLKIMGYCYFFAIIKVMTNNIDPNNLSNNETNEQENAGGLSSEKRQMAASALSKNSGSDDNEKEVRPANDLAERLRKARRAMAGPEKAAEWERENQQNEIESEKANLNQKLQDIDKQKESLEISWIALDNKRAGLKKNLDPVLAEEEKVELKEDTLEGKERTTPLAEERRKIEEQRWEVQKKRRNLEEKKWDLEEKLTKINANIKENTENYRGLLKEEEKIKKQLEEIENENHLIEEQIKLEKEEKKRQALEQLTLEEKRRQQEAKKEKEREAREKQAQIKAEKERQARAEAEEKSKPPKQQTPIQQPKTQSPGGNAHQTSSILQQTGQPSKDTKPENDIITDQKRHEELQRALRLKRERGESRSNPATTPTVEENKKPRSESNNDQPEQNLREDLIKTRTELEEIKKQLADMRDTQTGQTPPSTPKPEPQSDSRPDNTSRAEENFATYPQTKQTETLNALNIDSGLSEESAPEPPPQPETAKLDQEPQTDTPPEPPTPSNEAPAGPQPEETPYSDDDSQRRKAEILSAINIDPEISEEASDNYSLDQDSRNPQNQVGDIEPPSRKNNEPPIPASNFAPENPEPNPDEQEETLPRLRTFQTDARQVQGSSGDQDLEKLRKKFPWLGS